MKMKIKLSDFRYTRNLYRAYQASLARQEINPQAWREDGLTATAQELHAALDFWAARGQERVYNRACH